MNNPNTKYLRPFPPGVSGNPAGRPKGSKNFTTVIQKLLNDKAFVDKVISKKPSWWKDLPKNSRNGLNAVTTAMMIKAMGGDSGAANWLARHGYGDKLMVGNDPDNPLPMLPADPETSMAFAHFMMQRTKKPIKQPKAVQNAKTSKTKS